MRSRALTGLAFACAIIPLASAQEAPIPMAGELPGRPFAIQKKWMIGGPGGWGYLTLDTAARQLFIAHGPQVQVVDVESGTVSGTVQGFLDANQVVLDDSGGFGYVSDATASAVKIFDRGTFQVVATIPVANPPRALVLDPSSGLLLAICAGPTLSEEFGELPRKPGIARQYPRGNQRPPTLSTLSVIDPQTRTLLANVFLPGKLGFASGGICGCSSTLLPSSRQTTRNLCSAFRSPLQHLVIPLQHLVIPLQHLVILSEAQRSRRTCGCF